MSDRVLMLSWEYPPVIEGGLARHVRKLAEALVRQGVAVEVLTRGRGEGPQPSPPVPGGAAAVVGHRAPQPRAPRNGERIVGWAGRTNRAMPAAGQEVAA